MTSTKSTEVEARTPSPKMPWLWVVSICLLDMGSTFLTTPVCPPLRTTSRDPIASIP